MAFQFLYLTMETVVFSSLELGHRKLEENWRLDLLTEIPVAVVFISVWITKLHYWIVNPLCDKNGNCYWNSVWQNNLLKRRSSCGSAHCLMIAPTTDWLPMVSILFKLHSARIDRDEAVLGRSNAKTSKLDKFFEFVPWLDNSLLCRKNWRVRFHRDSPLQLLHTELFCWSVPLD